LVDLLANDVEEVISRRMDIQGRGQILVGEGDRAAWLRLLGLPGDTLGGC
jgi:hypothetical protein